MGYFWKNINTLNSKIFLKFWFNKTYLLSLILGVVLSPNLFWAQEFINHFDKLNTRNGLSQSDVRSIYQDKTGYIWIGTYDGLNRYDGYTIKIFRKTFGKTNSLRSNLISCITEDERGNIWIGTDDQGVSMYNKSTGEFTHFYNTIHDPDFLSDNRITSLAIDKKANVWIGTSKGLNRLTIDYKTNKASNQIYRKSMDQYGFLNSDRIACLYVDKNDNLWIGTSHGVSRYIGNANSSSNGQFQNYELPFSIQVTSIAETSKSIIIGSYDLFDLNKKDINKAKPKFNLLGSVQAYRVLAYDDDILWCTSNEGIKIFKYSNHTIENIKHFKHQWGDSKSLSNDHVLCFMKDNTGILWIGTNGGGVNIYKPNNRNFRHYNRNENEGSLSRNKIRSIFEDSEGNLWIGTDGGVSLNFLSKDHPLDYETGFKKINITDSKGVDSHVFSINEIIIKNKPHLLIGTGYPSNIKYGRTEDIIHDNFLSGKNTMQPSEQVYASLVDSNNIVWLGTYLDGLFRYELDEYGKVVNEKNFKYVSNDPSCISSNIVRSLAQDKKGNIWIGTAEGLNKLTPDEQKKDSPNFIKYYHDPEDRYTISHNYILPILVTEKGHIWVGTLGGGLNKIISSEGSEKDHFLSYDTRDGLPNNVIKAIIEDDNYDLWCSTNNGLTRFSPEELEFQNFGPDDGLQDTEFSELAAWKRASGELLFGGINGFNAFFPTEIVADSSNVELVFEDLQILNQTIKIGDTIGGRVPLSRNINEIQELTLKHNEGSFSLGFSALHYAAPMQNKYAYKLEGFDNDWVYTSASSRTAKYTNLSPGEYVLTVKASNNYGHWSNKNLRLKIIVKSPWWATNWAYFFYGMILFVSLVLFRKFTIIRTTKKNQYVLEAMEKEKLEELSQLKLRFFTNISHEFRTPLTLIVGFIERLQSFSPTLTEAERQKYYNNIFKNSKILLKLINQLINFRKLEQGKLKLKVSFSSITEFISLLSENFNEVAATKKIDYKIVYDENIETWFDAEIIERILFNLLSNAFKFTPEGGKIIVKISKDQDYTFIEVEDNGRGIPEDVQTHIFERFTSIDHTQNFGSGIGLSFIKSLIEIHHGNISFKSKENHGTTFKVILPIDKSTYAIDEISEGGKNFNGYTNPQGWLLPNFDLQQSPNGRSHKGKLQTILLVEDNNDILYFLEETFKNRFNIYKAEEGQQALDICLENTIDLVISDIMMQGMDGFEFCEKLKSDDRINHVPVILLTAKNSPENKIKGYSLGADAYIVKPFSLQELETRVETLLDTRNKIIKKFKHELDVSPSEVGLTSIDERFINRVLKYVEENISNSEFTVDMLARECGLGRMELNKKLKALVGFTTNAFIRHIRIKRAAQLLKRDMHTVTEIMYEVGFNDPQYFRESFKKQTGLTPSSFKKQDLQNEHN